VQGTGNCCLRAWTIQSAIEEAISAEVLTAALFARFRSRQEYSFAEKMLSSMRNKFGGHVEIYPVD
jgi:6-phosphogluconate dehydrogenase